MREALNELEGAVQTVEQSLEDNRGVVKGNVAGLESRIETLLGRLEELGRSGDS
jgi:nuclear migration protein JNM1